MMHPDIQADVAAARAALRPNGHTHVAADPTTQLARQQAAALVRTAPELMAWMTHRYLVTHAEAPPQGVDLAQWMLARALQASVVEDLYHLASQHTETHHG